MTLKYVAPRNGRHGTALATGKSRRVGLPAYKPQRKTQSAARYITSVEKKAPPCIYWHGSEECGVRTCDGPGNCARVRPKGKKRAPLQTAGPELQEREKSVTARSRVTSWECEAVVRSKWYRGKITTEALTGWRDGCKRSASASDVFALEVEWAKAANINALQKHPRVRAETRNLRHA